ncbi:hypothetical protein PR001_g971 [Phytophthora rubi]|uniref:Uncharacterized protein n=1 Tax=Phytophthora rubi TaxID=129364 RepID=A0A6A3P8K5_9STRA|nr:hypothetical protein PR002_g1094 [Phytophthora rubi]KAE9051943.1 hypothetical protein PR001_g971 [Phytophthora rubi]
MSERARPSEHPTPEPAHHNAKEPPDDIRTLVTD